MRRCVAALALAVALLGGGAAGAGAQTTTAQDERLGEILAERLDYNRAREGGAHLDRQLVEALVPGVVVLRGRQ